MTSMVSRRRFLALTGTGVCATALAACSFTHAAEYSGGGAALKLGAVEGGEHTTATPTPRPTPVLEPRSRRVVSLMPGTAWQADGVAIHSGQPGPRIMVLGGVHGNEPGGWLAAQSIAEWEIERGSLLVLPRLNWRSASAFVRTLPDYGDLNRLYPGDVNSTQPMARMAAAVIEAGRAFQPELLFDLHESWVFYAERGAGSGTAFIGQTVSIGTGATETTVDRISNVVRSVNGEISAREEFYMRGAATPRPGVRVVPSNPSPGGSTPPSVTPAPGPNGVSFGGTSSLSLGRWIEGCVPILIEMGQQNEDESRRSELHQMLVRTTLAQSGMFG